MGRLSDRRFHVHQAILRSLYYAGVSMPGPALDIRVHPETSTLEADEDGVDTLLARARLFVALTRDELHYLSAHSAHNLCRAGEAILRQGEARDSLFMLREGLLAVRVVGEMGQDTEVGRLKAGQLFGERSLLLGEPRNATVVALVDSMVTEISKEAIAALMQQRPEISDSMSRILGEREAATRSRLEAGVEIGRKPWTR